MSSNHGKKPFQFPVPDLRPYPRPWVQGRYPDGLLEIIEGPKRDLTKSDTDILLSFLDQNPYFFRSGYAKQKAIQRLGRAPLSDESRERIAKILEAAVAGGWQHSMTGWRHLHRFLSRRGVLEMAKRYLGSYDKGVSQKAIDLVWTVAPGLDFRRRYGKKREELTDKAWAAINAELGP